jgi:hypothetical protein
MVRRCKLSYASIGGDISLDNVFLLRYKPSYTYLETINEFELR